MHVCRVQAILTVVAKALWRVAPTYRFSAVCFEACRCNITSTNIVQSSHPVYDCKSQWAVAMIANYCSVRDDRKRMAASEPVGPSSSVRNVPHKRNRSNWVYLLFSWTMMWPTVQLTGRHGRQALCDFSSIFASLTVTSFCRPVGTLSAALVGLIHMYVMSSDLSKSN